MKEQRKLILFNISGPYAVGKDSILNVLIATFPQLHRVRTVTTRPVLASADPSYENLSPDAFFLRTSLGRWIVNSQLAGSVQYGTSVDEIEAVAAAGELSLHSIYAGPAGAGRLREIFGKRLLSVGLLAAQGGREGQLAILRQRLIARGRDDAATVEARLEHQNEPIEYVAANPLVITPDGEMNVFDVVHYNEDLEVTVQAVVELITRIFLDGDK